MERLLSAYSSRSQTIIEGSQDGNSSRNQNRKLGGMHLTDLLSGLCSVIFPMQPKLTCPGMVQPTVGWALPHHQSGQLSQPWPQANAIQSVLEVSLASEDSRLCHVEHKIWPVLIFSHQGLLDHISHLKVLCLKNRFQETPTCDILTPHHLPLLSRVQSHRVFLVDCMQTPGLS